MTDFRYTTTVTAATGDEADQVMAERLGPDEDYGFEYRLDYRPAKAATGYPAVVAWGREVGEVDGVALVRSEAEESAVVNDVVPDDCFYAVHPLTTP